MRKGYKTKFHRINLTRKKYLGRSTRITRQISFITLKAVISHRVVTTRRFIISRASL